MPAAIDRITFTPASQSHAELINLWATLTGRSTASLVSSLLEEAINTAISNGKAHPTAVKLMEKLNKEREQEVRGYFQSCIVDIRSRIDEEFAAGKRDEPGIGYSTFFKGTDGPVDITTLRPFGHFTDKEWVEDRGEFGLDWFLPLYNLFKSEKVYTEALEVFRPVEKEWTLPKFESIIQHIKDNCKSDKEKLDQFKFFCRPGIGLLSSPFISKHFHKWVTPSDI